MSEQPNDQVMDDATTVIGTWRDISRHHERPADTVEEFGFATTAQAVRIMTAAYIRRVNEALQPWRTTVDEDGLIRGPQLPESAWRDMAQAVADIDLLDVSEVLHPG